MMKKITRNSLLVLAIVVLLASFATPAYAVTANVSPIQSRHSKDVAALTNAAEYHGWHADLRGKTGSPSKIVTIATLRNYRYRVPTDNHPDLWPSVFLAVLLVCFCVASKSSYLKLL